MYPVDPQGPGGLLFPLLCFHGDSGRNAKWGPPPSLRQRGSVPRRSDTSLSERQLSLHQQRRINCKRRFSNRQCQHWFAQLCPYSEISASLQWLACSDIRRIRVVVACAPENSFDCWLILCPVPDFPVSTSSVPGPCLYRFYNFLLVRRYDWGSNPIYSMISGNLPC